MSERVLCEWYREEVRAKVVGRRAAYCCRIREAELRAEEAMQPRGQARTSHQLACIALKALDGNSRAAEVALNVLLDHLNLQPTEAVFEQHSKLHNCNKLHVSSVQLALVK